MELVVILCVELNGIWVICDYWLFRDGLIFVCGLSVVKDYNIFVKILRLFKIRENSYILGKNVFYRSI